MQTVKILQKAARRPAANKEPLWRPVSMEVALDPQAQAQATRGTRLLDLAGSA